MKRYDDLILNKLIDSYEGRRNSSAFPLAAEKEGRGKGSRRIFFYINTKTVPEYFDTAAFSYQVLHDQLGQLEEKGLVRLFWKNGKKGHILEKVSLNEEKIPDCYRLLGRTPKSEKQERILEIIEKENEA